MNVLSEVALSILRTVCSTRPSPSSPVSRQFQWLLHSSPYRIEATASCLFHSSEDLVVYDIICPGLVQEVMIAPLGQKPKIIQNGYRSSVAAQGNNMVSLGNTLVFLILFASLVLPRVNYYRSQHSCTEDLVECPTHELVGGKPHPCQSLDTHCLLDL